MAARQPPAEGGREPDPAAPATRPATPPGEDPSADAFADDEAIADALEDETGNEHVRYRLSRDAKNRLDKYLQNRLRHISRHQIQKLIGQGGVRVNDRPAKASTRLKKDDVVDVILPPKPTRELQPEPMDLDILYEDAGFIVLNKPANLIVHPARGQLSGTMLNGLAYHFQQQNQGAALSTVGQREARPGIVHRLDKHTTGVIIVAKQDEPHWQLARQFEERSNLKAYLALVHGCPDPPGGAIEQPIGKHPTIREAMAVRQDAAAKRSLTLYRVRERYRGYSLVELELKTGRTHQIRVHMSYIGHPVVGDIVYGGEPIGRAEIDDPPLAAGARAFLTYARDKTEGEKLEAASAAREDMLLYTPALHAALLRMVHPGTGKAMTFTAPVPSPMRDVIDALRQHLEAGPVVTEGYHVDLAAALP
ncbi:MAG: RluA family pseudouridine synthase [Phycisphaeraceae bacterium]